jgi:hypothetical protein
LIKQKKKERKCLHFFIAIIGVEEEQIHVHDLEVNVMFEKKQQQKKSSFLSKTKK